MTGDYGTAGRIGVGTPQANPTVEAEFRRLLPADVEFVTTRLRSSGTSLRDRLVDYLERLDEYLEAYGGMQLDAFCFACTGSSYFVGHAREQTIVADIAARFGYPVLTATDAVNRQLRALGARRIAVVAPYPDWLLREAAEFWSGRGFDVVLTRRVATSRPDDTSSIYELSGADALAAVRDAGVAGVDALLLSGTGMATLSALGEIRALAGVPVLTSNGALADESLKLLGAESVSYR